MTTKILLIGDSHTREMATAIIKAKTSCLVYTVTVGQGLNQIIDKYHSKLQYIIQFQPSIVIVHAGHNDISYHHNYNLHPRNPRVVTQEILHFIDEISHNFPNIIPYISSIYPKTHTDHSYLNPADIVSYNKKVKRHGQHLTTITNDSHISCLLNNCLWTHINSSIENPDPYDFDGLHLSKAGQETVAAEWISTIFPTVN
jgi:lysophospholipase L1-like esterase